MKKRIFAAMLSVCMGITMLNVPVKVNAQTYVRSDDIVILYTNDVHTHIYDEDKLSYDNIAAMKKDILEVTDNVLLVDAGDHIQGTAYGAMDNGQSIIKLMNAAGYDLATLGNHEFDYGMSGMYAAVEAADYPYISCNFKSLETGQNVLESYMMYDFDGVKVAVIGITTPDTITSSAPAYFQDGQGNFIYEISGGADGKALYETVQNTIDEVESEGADYVIALGHMGVDPSSVPYTSKEVIANTEGLDAFIDGHSHTTIVSEKVNDKSGEEVVLTQTGSYFDSVGQLRIQSDGTITTELIDNYETADVSVTAILESWVNDVDRQLGEKIAVSENYFAINDENDNRLVRIMGTNMTDFTADSYYYALNEVDGVGCDVAIINGGGVRDSAPAGEWTYKTVKAVNPFGNVICVMNVTGQQILDALEWGARFTTGEVSSPEGGGLLHTAGLVYKVDPTVESTVKESEGLWTGAPTGKYRVYDVEIYNRETNKYEPLDKNKTYSIGGTNYTLRNMGDGFNMFAGATLVKDYIFEDYLAMSEYAKAFKDTDNDGFGNINSANSPLALYEGYKLNYEDIYGSRRIDITEQKEESLNPGNPPAGNENGDKTDDSVNKNDTDKNKTDKNDKDKNNADDNSADKNNADKNNADKNNAPHTGDSTYIWLCIGFIVISGAAYSLANSKCKKSDI